MSIKKGNIEFNEYNYYKNRLSTTIRKAKSDYFLDKFNTHVGNIKKTWQYLRGFLNNDTKHDVITLMDDTNNEINDCTAVANICNNFFTSVGPKLDEAIPIVDKCVTHFMGPSVDH